MNQRPMQQLGISQGHTKHELKLITTTTKTDICIARKQVFSFMKKPIAKRIGPLQEGLWKPAPLSPVQRLQRIVLLEGICQVLAALVAHAIPAGHVPRIEAKALLRPF